MAEKGACCCQFIDDVQSPCRRYKRSMPQDGLMPSSSDAQFSLRIGRAIAVDGSVTARGFLGIGVIVAAGLLGSAAIVIAARSRPRQLRGSPGSGPNG